MTRRNPVDYALERGAAKRGGRRARVDLDRFEIGVTPEQTEEVLAVDEALTRLKECDPQQERIVEIRYYGAPGSVSAPTGRIEDRVCRPRSTFGFLNGASTWFSMISTASPAAKIVFHKLALTERP